jgi:hypothetical protein
LQVFIKVCPLLEQRLQVPFPNPFDVRRYDGLCAITLVGELNASSLGKALAAFSSEKIVGLGTGRSSITVFAKIGDKKALLSQLCQIEGVKGVSLKENVGAIDVLSPEFIESPGWVAKISSALAEKGNKHRGDFFKQSHNRRFSGGKRLRQGSRGHQNPKRLREVFKWKF